MKTVVNLRKCMIGILMLSVTGGEMVQARRYTTYRKPVYTTGRYRVTVINHMSSPVRRDVQAGFKLLMQKYKETVYWYIRRLVVSHEDAQDVAQETFLRIFRSFSQFKGGCSFKAWIYRIETNEALRQLDARKKEIESLNDHDETAIQALPMKQQVTFQLRYYDELDYEEIAKVTGTKSIMASTVNS